MADRIRIRGGDVFLSQDKTIQKKDILVAGDKIVGIEDPAEVHEDAGTIDAHGKLVTPGLIDFHMHAFLYGHLLSVDTEELAPRSGTTTFVDGGSAGALNFLAFREYVIRPARSNILAFLNASALGQATDGVQGLHFYENDDERLLHIPSALEVIEKNRDLIVGIKVRAYTGLRSLQPLEKARQLADSTKLPLMAHIAPPPPEFDRILPYLKEGDIITHPYHGGEKTILDDRGKVRPEFWEAKKRGIEVDLGLNRFHGNLDVARRAMDQGFLPDYISTDLAVTSLDHFVHDLPTTVSKLVALGLSLVEALTRCTYTPAVKLGREREMGCLQEGTSADIAIFDIRRDDHLFEDFFGSRIKAKERIVPSMTLLRGEGLTQVKRETESWDFVFKWNTPWDKR